MKKIWLFDGKTAEEIEANAGKSEIVWVSPLFGKFTSLRRQLSFDIQIACNIQTVVLSITKKRNDDNRLVSFVEFLLVQVHISTCERPCDVFLKRIQHEWVNESWKLCESREFFVFNWKFVAMRWMNWELIFTHRHRMIKKKRYIIER